MYTQYQNNSPILLFGDSAVTVETLTNVRALSTDVGIAFFDSATSESGWDIDDIFTVRVMMEELSDYQCKELFEHIAMGGRVKFSSQEKDVAKRSIIESKIGGLFLEYFENENYWLKKARRYMKARRYKDSALLPATNCNEARISELARALEINIIDGARDPRLAQTFLDEKSARVAKTSRIAYFCRYFLKLLTRS